MQLNISDLIEKKLKIIIDEAIKSGKIDSDKLRMIIISPNKTFDVLKVTYNNEWDEYYYEAEYNDAGDIGSISISQWLDTADTAFESRDKLDQSFIDIAKEHNKKYREVKPALNFDHISHKLYKDYLVCLREELISQIEKAIKTVATSYSQNDFKHVVGFASYKLCFFNEEEVQLLGFNHPDGAGSFYNVKLSLPNSKLTYPYLKFYESGFHLFYPESNIYEGPEEESNIYSYGIDNINYAYIKPKRMEEVFFRLNDEFEDWRLDGGHINEDIGDLSEKAFVNAFEEFINRFPEKILQTNTIPNPVNEEENFKKWIASIIKNNLSISYDNKTLIYNYSEEAFRKTLELLPNTHKDHQDLLKFLAGKLFEEGRYKESAEILKSIKKLSDHYKIHLLENLYYLDDKVVFDTCLNSIENESAKTDALLSKWLYDIRLYNDQKEKLLELKEELVSYIDKKKGYTTASRASLALTKLYTVLDDKKNALLAFKKINFRYSSLSIIFQKEFTDVNYIQDAYNDYLAKGKREEDFKAWVETSAIVIPEKDKQETEKVLYEDCYYLTHKIENVDLTCAFPISENQFIAVNNDKELFLGEITNTYELVKHATVQLDKDKSYSYTYQDNILYVSYYNKGIVRYQIEGNTIIHLQGVIKNEKSKSKLQSLTIADGYLYVSNNSYLEIFDLSDINAEPISSELFIESGYNLYVQKNLLVVGAGGGLVILIDIKDKNNPKYLSTIKEDMTPEDMHIEFIDNYLISRSVIDISDPKNPKFICHTWDELAPTYYFTEKPPVKLYSTGDEFLFKTLHVDKNNVSVKNWLENLNKENLDYEQLVYNLATSFLGNTVIGFSKNNICILEKGKNKEYKKEKFDIQEILDNMAKECFDYLIENHPDFSIGKIIFENKPDYGNIRLSFHECSSPGILSDFYDEPELSILQTNFEFYSYFKNELNLDFNAKTMRVNCNLNTIIDTLILDPRFSHVASKHISVIINNESRYLHYPDNNWKPYRKIIETEDTETVEAILLSDNDNLVKKLVKQITTEESIFEELVQILNLKYAEEKKQAKYNSLPNNKTIAKEKHDTKPSYIQEPILNQKKKENKPEKIQKLKDQAFQIICSYPNRKIVKNILLHGAKYSIPKSVLEETPVKINLDIFYISMLAHNRYGLWDSFSEDSEIKAFLISLLDTLEDNSITLRIAYRYKIYNHPSIYTYIQKLLKDCKLDYYVYKDDSLDLSLLPNAVIEDFKPQLLDVYNLYENSTDESQNWWLKNQIIPVCDMLVKLGHEEFPEKLVSKINSIKNDFERYDDDDDMFGDDNDNEEMFLLQLYRKQQVKYILKNFELDIETPIWDADWAPEPYKKSWRNAIETILDQGGEVFGEKFMGLFSKKLCANIPKDETYNNDRLLAFNFIHYTYKHIQKRPELASYAEGIVKIINLHKEKFTKKIDLYKIKEKGKYALLQAAWNDLKNEDLDLAEQKGDAILAIDPEFGQVYFLKARLLWLKEGVSAYLKKQEEFIEKATHDVAALGRLYNLTGCALDIEKRYEESVPYFKKAALAVPSELMYIANIAEMYYKLKQPVKAVKYAKKVVEQGESTDMMSEILANKGVLKE